MKIHKKSTSVVFWLEKLRDAETPRQKYDLAFKIAGLFACLQTDEKDLSREDREGNRKAIEEFVA